MLSLYLLLVLLHRASKSQGFLHYTDLGDNVTLSCFYPSITSYYLSWYKEAAGGKPQLISYSYTATASNKFKSPFKDDPRFSVEAGAGYYHLIISNVQQSDSAVYYCGRTSITVVEFGDGIFLVVKESSRRSFIQQPVSESVQPGGSVTLNCTVQTGTSDGEHRVHWFRHNSGESHLGIMYTHGHRDGQCEKSTAQPRAQSCVYSLPKRDISLSDDGMYYCAVASCGEILFGNGTRLDVGGKQDGHHLDALLLWIYCLAAALMASFIIILALACALYDRTRRGHLQGGGLRPPSSGPDHTADHQNEESLQYVALDFKKKAKARRQRSAEENDSTVIYSCVRRPYLD